MSEGPTSADTSRTEPRAEASEPSWILVQALECDAPTAGSHRYGLWQTDEVLVERGDERACERSREGQRSLLRIRIPDRRLSAQHARLVRDGASFVLEDLESTNGSYVDGSRVRRALLQDGSLIELGRTLFYFRQVPAARGLSTDVEARPRRGEELSTLSPTLESAFARLSRVAVSQLPVLLTGETGTGKEILARAVHERSGRPGPFVPVNCGAIPESLMEAQLFGFVKGAFTGAVKNELGFVRTAANGTLFLDEIADLPAQSQAALLRVLQSGEVTPVGSAQPVHADVRLVAATHRDMTKMMEAGQFRKDLYARLAGFVSEIPPLRRRKEDLGHLIGTLLMRHATDAERLRIRPEAARALFHYDWPLNVRELEQCLAAAMVLAEDGVIALLHLPDPVRKCAHGVEGTRSTTPAPAHTPQSAEDRELLAALTEVLRETGGNVSETARRMGKARQQIQRWLRRFQIDPARFNPPAQG